MMYFANYIILIFFIKILSSNIQAFQLMKEGTSNGVRSLLLNRFRSSYVPSLFQPAGLQATQKRLISLTFSDFTTPSPSEKRPLSFTGYASPSNPTIIKHVFKDSPLRLSFLQSFVHKKGVLLAENTFKDAVEFRKTDLEPEKSFLDPHSIREVADILKSADYCIAHLFREKEKISLSKDVKATFLLHALAEHIASDDDWRSLEDFQHCSETITMIKKLLFSNYCVACEMKENGQPFLLSETKATNFFYALMDHFYRNSISSLEASYNPKMTFICGDSKSDFLVAVQANPATYWDQKNIACMSKDSKIKEAVIITILGGDRQIPTIWTKSGVDRQNLNIWKEGDDYVHIFQKSVLNSLTVHNLEQEDWITFFKEAPSMMREDMEKRITTDVVKQAFHRIERSYLPPYIRPPLRN